MSDFEPRIRHAIRVVHATYGDRVSVDVKNKDLLKFGRNLDVGTSRATVMNLPSGQLHETYVSDNTITHFASANAGDTQELVVEGHTTDGSGFTFVTQTVTLAGQTKTALTTPLARATRAHNNGATDLTGPVYFAQDVTFTGGVPQTASAVHLIIPAGANQTEKCATTLGDSDYWLISNAYADVSEKTAAFADFQLEVRRFGKVFRQQVDFTASTNGQGIVRFDPLFIVPPNSDVRLTAVADGAGTAVSGGIQGFLAIKVNG